MHYIANKITKASKTVTSLGRVRDRNFEYINHIHSNLVTTVYSHRLFRADSNDLASPSPRANSKVAADELEIKTNVKHV